MVCVSPHLLRVNRTAFKILHQTRVIALNFVFKGGKNQQIRSYKCQIYVIMRFELRVRLACREQV